MISILRWILLPFSLIYQLIVWIRNRMYDYNILKSTSFQIPTIVIGNLAVGGAGKSPMTEYLIRLLKNNYKIATLSRGYGRKTKGFKYVETTSTALEVGDEPLQFKNKFPEITVSVCEDRCQGVEQLTSNHDLVLLDDAFQHRKLKAGYYILLFDFQSLFSPLLTLPTGNFRDNFSSTKRADLIVITKCPDHITVEQKAKIERIIRQFNNAPIFYSAIQYNDAKAFNLASESINELRDYDVVLFCGIANPQPLIQYLNNLNNRITVIQFPDHHNYSQNDFQKVIKVYNELKSDKKIIITTEKDIQRISKEDFNNLPLYYIPISIKTDSYKGNQLDYYIKEYLKNHN